MFAISGGRYIGAAPTPIRVSDAVGIALLVGLELVAVWLVVKVWREQGRSSLVRLLWTAVILVPVLGLIAYAVWHDAPPPSDPMDRPPRHGWEP